MTKAKDWKFEKYIPDREDIEAEGRARTAFVNLNLKEPLKMNKEEEKVYYFVSGFFRGVAWTHLKHDLPIPGTGRPWEGLKPGTKKWMEMWKDHPEYQEGMSRYSKGEEPVIDDPTEFEVLYAVGVRHGEEYEMIAGPWPSEEKALDFEPYYSEEDEQGPIFLLKMKGQGPGNQDIPTYEILHRWHPTLGWVKRKRKVGEMERTT